GIIELNLFDQGAGQLELIFGLARKSDNNIGRNRNRRSGFSNASDKIDIFLGGISAVHCLQNSIGAGLHWQMKVIDQFWQATVGADQVFAEPDWMRRSEAKPF